MSRHPAFSQIDHRPWPLPQRPWILQQEWLDLLFLHWQIAPDALRPLVPQSLELDCFEGSAWIGVVPFRMRGVAPRGCPKPAFLCDFPEINIRTYVRHQGKPGVWFFSLDVPHRLPVWLARTLFHLPYFRAAMNVAQDDGHVRYQSRYRERAFSAAYRGREPFTPTEGSFEQWATERYCLYSQSRRGRLYRADVQHPRWPLQHADCSIEANTMLDAFPVGPRHPSQLYCRQLPVVAWSIQAC